jgi:hypothetical protein
LAGFLEEIGRYDPPDEGRAVRRYAQENDIRALTTFDYAGDIIEIRSPIRIRSDFVAILAAPTFARLGAALIVVGGYELRSFGGLITPLGGVVLVSRHLPSPFSKAAPI